MPWPNFLSLLRVSFDWLPFIDEKNELTRLLEGPNSVSCWTVNEGMMRLLFNLFPRGEQADVRGSLMCRGCQPGNGVGHDQVDFSGAVWGVEMSYSPVHQAE